MGTPNRLGERFCPLSLAHLVGLGLFQIALILFLLSSCAWVVPLLLFLVSTLAAPFFPQLQFFLPITQHGSRASRSVAITFDDGPDPATTPLLLDLLERYGVRATFFVVGEKAQRFPDIIRRMLQHGHELGNHTLDHDSWLMLRSQARLRDSIARCQQALAIFGVKPRIFRPPAWVTNSRLWRVLLEQRLECLGASRRSIDFGNRRLKGLAQRILAKIRCGDIIALHDLTPPSPRSVASWLLEVEQILVGLKQKEWPVESLSVLLGRPLMEKIDPSVVSRGDASVQRFYDGLASRYDQEQLQTGQAIRKIEQAVVANQLGGLLSGDAKVLELGAGTGRFTLELARQAREVTAMDISPRMLDQLTAKTKVAGLPNIKTRTGDMEVVPFGDGYDLICSFSAFEYVQDLEGLLRKASATLSAHGAIYFTTAHSCVFRFFAQMGNAMRQGVWLKARTKREVHRLLKAANLVPMIVRIHGLSIPGLGGLLLEVAAKANSPQVRGKMTEDQSS